MQQHNEEDDEKQTLKYQHTIKQQHPPSSSNLYYYKLCLIIVVVVFCMTTVLNISQYHYNQNNYEQFQQRQEAVIKIFNQTNLKDISYQQYNNQQSISLLLSPNIQTKQHKTYNQLITTSPNTIKRISMSAAQPNNHYLRIYTFIKSNYIQQQTNCILTTAVNSVTSTTIQSAQKMLGEQRYGKWILVVDRMDKNVNKMWSIFVRRYGGVADIKDMNVDADYQWIKDSVTYCKTITYLHHNTKITNPSQITIPTQPNSILYTQKVSINNKIIQLNNIQQVNIQQFTSSNKTIGNRINNYIFIFDSIYFRFITPLNFAYYAKYTIDQIVILPILAIGQGGNVIKPIKNIIHEVQNQWGDSGGKQFHIQQINNRNSQQAKQKRSYKLRNNYQVCFVSYPTIPNQISVKQISRYIKYLGNVQQIDKATIVISLPYIFDTTRLSRLYDVYTVLSNYTLNIRLRIHVNKSVSALSVYQSSYTYCPTSAIMITSRHNIIFNQQILTKLLPKINERTHYYSTNFLDSKQNIINFPPLVFSKAKFRNQLIYYDIFKHVQIFKSDLFRMLYFWILKSAEIQFYQSQAAFVVPLLEMVRLKVQVIDYVGFHVKEDRVMAGKQLEQMENIKLYFVWDIIPFNRLYPIKYNSLQNIAFRKNAPNKIQRKIHQVWLGKNPILPFQQKLHQTLIKANNNFQIYLWKDQNITQQNFPISFALISRSLQYQKHTNRSYAAPITSLIRYELLYHLSGIYLDFKTEGIKNLSPFLKYQIFFIDIDYGEQHYIYPANVGNGIMGATKNNYHLRLVLTQLIDQDKFNYLKWNFPTMVGGYVLRKALTDRELFTMAGFGFHLFSQKPGTGIPNLCSTINIKNIEPDQQKFAVKDLKNGRIFDIAIPCRVYKQAYVIMYKILAGSWQKGRKRQRFDQYMQNNIQLQQNKNKNKVTSNPQQ